MALRLLCRHLFTLITQPIQTSFCAVAMLRAASRPTFPDAQSPRLTVRLATLASSSKKS